MVIGPRGNEERRSGRADGGGRVRSVVAEPKAAMSGACRYETVRSTCATISWGLPLAGALQLRSAHRATVWTPPRLGNREVKKMKGRA
jgi:hypothetical protein